MPTLDEATIETALAGLDLESKVAILAGRDFWSIPAVPDIGLASLVMSDGPIGVRGTQWSATDPSIALPSPTALAATWDPELAREAGRLLGQEARRKGVHVLLAPTVNLHRSPLGGRHFEAYSEDPLLTGAIGVGYVGGVQEHSVGVTVKHFVANDSETDRFTVDARVDDRTLREMYLAPFETIVAAGAWGVMSSYNQVNGTTMSANTPLQRTVLKDEWGFDGVVVSDWYAARDTEETVHGGLDIAMPAPGPWGASLVAAVRAGAVAETEIDEQVRRVLRLAGRVGALEGVAPAVAEADRPAPIDGETLARQIAARSFVLAANPTGVLPLDVAAITRVALIGALAKDARVLGGGSARVFPRHIVSPLLGLTEALPASIELTYATGADPRNKLPSVAGPVTATFYDGDGVSLHTTTLADGAARWMDPPAELDVDRVASLELTVTITPERTGTHLLSLRGIGEFVLTVDGAVVFDGLAEPDSTDFAAIFLSPPELRFEVPLTAEKPANVTLRQQIGVTDPFVVGFTLGHAEPSPSADEMIEEAVRNASAADIAIVVVGTTDEVESEGFDRTTLALPGRQDELVSRVAAANPRTVVVVNAGSPVELPWADDVAAVLLTWFPGQEAGHALADVLLGATEPGGRLPTTWPVRAEDCPVLSTTPVDGALVYNEGVFIGYRAWQRTETAPRYPFGHGLGYTTWLYDQVSVDGRDVMVTVRNTGDRAGREVVQIYVGPSSPDADRPARWLAGFASVSAEAGAEVTVTISLAERAFQIWDGGWRTIAGSYVVEAAHSVEDRPLATTITVG
jgi:beta-glucosidase